MLKFLYHKGEHSIGTNRLFAPFTSLLSAIATAFVHIIMLYCAISKFSTYFTARRNDKSADLVTLIPQHFAAVGECCRQSVEEAHQGGVIPEFRINEEPYFRIFHFSS